MKKLKPGETITFTVTGSGAFPLDMLRYDRCWPKHEAQTSRLLPQHDRREVVMEGLRAPTVARWASFGWTAEVTL